MYFFLGFISLFRHLGAAPLGVRFVGDDRDDDELDEFVLVVVRAG